MQVRSAGLPDALISRECRTEEFTILVKGLAVGGDGPACAHIADHIPMQRRFIGWTTLRISRAHRGMKSATNLFIKKRILRIILDRLIRADHNLAHRPRTGIKIEHFNQEIRAGMQTSKIVGDQAGK